MQSDDDDARARLHAASERITALATAAGIGWGTDARLSP
jgi:hypothetical protein